MIYHACLLLRKSINTYDGIEASTGGESTGAYSDIPSTGTADVRLVETGVGTLDGGFGRWLLSRSFSVQKD